MTRVIEWRLENLLETWHQVESVWTRPETSGGPRSGEDGKRTHADVQGTEDRGPTRLPCTLHCPIQRHQQVVFQAPGLGGSATIGRKFLLSFFLSGPGDGPQPVPSCLVEEGSETGNMWWPVPGRRVSGERPPPGPQHKLVHSRSSDGHPGEKRRGESWQLSLGEHSERQGIRKVTEEVWLWSKDSDGIREPGAAPTLLPVGPRQASQTPALSPLTGGGQTGGCPRTPPALKDTVWECAHLASR